MVSERPRSYLRLLAWLTFFTRRLRKNHSSLILILHFQQILICACLKYYTATRQSRPRQSPSAEQEWDQTIQTIVGTVRNECGRSGRSEIWSLYINSLCWSEERRREDRKCRSKQRVLSCVQYYNIKQTGRWKVHTNVLNTELHCESCSRKQRESTDAYRNGGRGEQGEERSSQADCTDDKLPAGMTWRLCERCQVKCQLSNCRVPSKQRRREVTESSDNNCKAPR